MPRRYYPPRGEVYKKYTPPPFRPLTSESEVFRRDEGVFYPSNDSGAHLTHKTEAQRYTGSLVKGIATMHKSNAVPVIDDQHAKDISAMRRG